MAGGAGILLGCVCLIFGIVVALFIYSLIIRASVWIANKCLGGAPAARSSYYDDDYDDDYDNDDDDYDAYDRRPARRRRGGGGSGGPIPEPSLARGMGIAFVVFIANIVVGVVILAVTGGLAAAGRGGGPFKPGGGGDVGTELAANCCSTIIGFFVLAGLLTAMLPTSFGRASLVSLFVHIILFMIGVIIGVVLVVAFGVAAFK
jgi:hypothetical protein